MQEQLRDTHRRTVNAKMVPGWGVDADPENDPTFPMKQHVEGEHQPYTGHRPSRPDQQTSSVEVLHSNERPNLSAVFGTKLPPSGLSGMIRRAAFNFSENSYGHWLPLMLADRVEMVEGVVDDLAHGHIPNVFSEAGWKADWKYNRKAVVTKVAVGTALAVGVYALIRSMRSDKSDDTGTRVWGGDSNTQSSGAFASRGQMDSIRSEQKSMMEERMSSQTGDQAKMTGSDTSAKQSTSDSTTRSAESKGSGAQASSAKSSELSSIGKTEDRTPRSGQSGSRSNSSPGSKSSPTDARGL